MKTLKLIFILLLLSTSAFSQSGWVEQRADCVYSLTGALSCVYFLNENTGWIGGQFGLLNKTTNGGMNWVHVPTYEENHYNKIMFLNSSTGFVCGSNFLSGIVLKTTNSGANWNQVIGTGDRNIAQDIYFIDQNTGWFCAQGIYKTTNQGTNWSRALIPGHEDFNLTHLSFPTSSIGYCTGWYFDELTSEQFTIIAKSTDGGVNWMVLRKRLSLYTDIQFLNEYTGYVNGLSPLKTTNGGTTWKNILDSTEYFILGMKFINVNKGWFGSSSNPVLTTNGGDTWTYQTLPVQSNVHDIFCLNDSLAWCVGMNNNSFPKVFKTTTGGMSFVQLTSQIVPDDFTLSQNYPNPFNPTTNLEFGISELGFVTLKVYDVLGNEVATLVNERLSPGSYEVEFNGNNFSSGTYFYRLTAGEFSEVKRMILLK